MKLENLNNALSTSLDVAAGLAIPLTISYSGGILYGIIFKTDTTLTACAFAISRLVYDLFRIAVYKLSGGEKINAKAYYLSQLLGLALLGMVQIIAFRQLNLIGSIGTAILSGLLLAGSVRMIDLTLRG